MTKQTSQLRFGTAGIPHEVKVRSSLAGIRYSVEELHAETMELEWVRGVRVSQQTVAELRALCEELNFVPTAHAPYYVNFNSPERKTVDESIYRVADSLILAAQIGVKSVALHVGFNHGQTSVEVAPKIIKAIKRLNAILKPSVRQNVKLAVETMGKASQFGSLLECIGLAKEFKNVSVCLDIAHLYARSRGELNSYDEFRGVLQKIKDELGQEALNELHMHVSGIEFGSAGERRHLRLEESKLKWREFLQAVRDMRVGGFLICESPEQAEDLKLIQKEWSKIA